MPLVAFKKTHPRIYIFSNFNMFVKQILKDSPMNLKNCISSHFYATVQFANSLPLKWDYRVCLGTRIARKVSKQYCRSLCIVRKRKFPIASEKSRLIALEKKLENLLPVDSSLLELIVVSNIGHVSLTTAFSSYLLILCSCFNKFLFTINWFLLLDWLIINIKYWLKI